jgi:hypothetical protein
MLNPKEEIIDETVPPRSRRQRFLWEAHEDSLRVSKWLLFILTISIGGNVVLGFALFQVFHRPMPVLSDDRGYVQYHTTEVYRLTDRRVKAFLDTTLVRMLTVFPSYYDLTSIEPMLSQEVLANFTGATNAQVDLRQKTDRRQMFNIYQIARFHNTQYPQFLNFLVRGEKTVYQRKTDRNGNTTTVPESQIVHWSVYLQEVTPTPENPFGLKIVGASPLSEAEASKFWPMSHVIWPPQESSHAPSSSQ